VIDNADFKWHAGYIIPPNNFVMPPNIRYSNEDYNSHANLTEIKFSRISEKLNEYELDDGTLIKAKLQIDLIKKSKLALQDGSPFYLINISGIRNEIQQPKLSS
jgi:hypothetical protein